MALYTVSYDLKQADPVTRGAFVFKALTLRWERTISSPEGDLYELPENTLGGLFDTLADAEKAFLAVPPLCEANGVPATLRKWILCDVKECRFNSDEVG